MKHKIFTLLLAVMASAGTMFAESGTCGLNLTWDLTDGVLTISGTWNMYNYSYSSAPWYALRSSIRSVVIKDGVTTIGEGAFLDCTDMTSVTIPTSVTSIGKRAFYNCTGLKKIDIPNGVEKIGDNAFNCCFSLASATIPNSVVSIGDYAFMDCHNLTSVTIPSSVNSISHGVFSFCSGLTSVVVENGNTTYDSRDNCNAIIETASNTLIAGCKNTVIPNSVTNIGMEAFYGCASMTSVTISSNITSIGSMALAGCSGLTSVVVENGNTTYDSRDNCNAIIETASNTLIAGCQNTVIPNSVTHISTEAFYGCAGLISITIPRSVTSIDPDAFDKCAGLASLVVENDNTTYDSRDNCNAVIETASNTLIVGCKNTTIPSSVTSIGYQAFYNCIGLTSIVIPSSVTSIGYYAFESCRGLTSVSNYATTPHIIDEKDVFAGVDLSACTLYVPAESVAAYKAADVWKEFGNIVAIEDTPEPCSIASGTCGAQGDNLTWTLTCDSVLTVTGSGDMRNGITNLGWHQYASYIRVVILPEGLTSIGEEAFYNCIDLQSVNMPESVSVLGNKAFVGCNSLTVPVYNSKIFAFMPRNYDGSYSIPEGIETVAAYAFEKCISNGGALYEIALPSTVKHLGDYSLGAPYLQKIKCIAVDPPICDTKAFVCFFDEQDVIYFVNKSIPVYVPAQSVEAYKAADVWKEFENILPIEGTETPIETVEGNYTIYYVDKDSQDLTDEIVTLHVPVAPVIEGFTFVEWRVSEGSLSLGITIQAVYEANNPTSAPAVYTNPANPAQKLIRNGNVYILQDENIYTIQGQKVK